MIERKAAGEEIVVVQAPDDRTDAPVPDLMAALKACLDAVRAKDTGAKPAKPRKRTPAPKAAKPAPGGSRKPAAPRGKSAAKTD